MENTHIKSVRTVSSRDVSAKLVLNVFKSTGKRGSRGLKRVLQRIVERRGNSRFEQNEELNKVKRREENFSLSE